MTGWNECERVFPDQVITDRFHILGKIGTADGQDGSCYDRYLLDRHYRYIDKTPPVAAVARQANSAASITFVKMAESGDIDDVTAGEHAALFAEWEPDATYTSGAYRRYNGALYRCLTSHTAQANWTPDATPSLWKMAADPAEEWPEWSQPIGAADAYGEGDKVSHGGKHWTSDLDGNVWEPGVYGWTEAE